MGREDDKMAVVDSELKVYGVDNLRIADASVMPLITSGNTNAPSIMIGERAAVSEFRSASARWAQGILSPQNVSVLAFGAAGLDLGRLSAIGLASARDKEREREKLPSAHRRSCLSYSSFLRSITDRVGLVVVVVVVVVVVTLSFQRERERKKERKRYIHISV